MSPADKAAYISAAAAVVQAFGAVIVLGYVHQQVTGERRDRQAAEQSADAKAAGIAYRFRRAVLMMLPGTPDADASTLERSWSTMSVHDVTSHARDLEALLEEIYALSGETSPDVTDVIRRAYVHGLRAVEHIVAYVQAPSVSYRDGIDQAWLYHQRPAAAAKELRNVVELFDAMPIQFDLAKRYDALENERRQQTPSARVAEHYERNPPL
jgi:hypothetical protein